VVGADDERVPFEKLVRAPRGLEESRDRRIAPLERLLRAVGPEQVRCKVVVRQVVDEQVEAVARDQPATDARCVGIEGALRPAEQADGGSRGVRLEQAVVEEAPGPVDRTRETGNDRNVARAAAIAREIHGGRNQPGVLDRLEDGQRTGSEVTLVHLVDGVAPGAQRAGASHGRERRPVLDEPPFLARVPDEMGDLVDVGMRTRRDRRETDRRQRREGRDRAPVAALRGKEREGLCAAGLHGSLEDARRETVDDRKDQLPRLGQSQSRARMRSPA
jgi:hypothetical protein